jgi:hypothetical protein
LRQGEFTLIGDAANWLVAETIGLSFEGSGKFSGCFGQAFGNASPPETLPDQANQSAHNPPSPSAPADPF